MYNSYSPNESSIHILFFVESSDIKSSSGCLMLITLDKEPQLLVESETVAVISPGGVIILKYPFSTSDSTMLNEISVFHIML